jgi:DNA-directed RNA polymerase subunit RPC12/RpoP
MLAEESAPAQTAPIQTPEPPAAATPPPAVSGEAALVFSCPECNTKVKLPAKLKGKRVRCPRCKAIFKAPGENDET